MDVSLTLKKDGNFYYWLLVARIVMIAHIHMFGML